MRKQPGSNLTEYGLLLALVGITSLGALSTMGNQFGQFMGHALDEALGPVQASSHPADDHPSGWPNVSGGNQPLTPDLTPISAQPSSDGGFEVGHGGSSLPVKLPPEKSPSADDEPQNCMQSLRGCLHPKPAQMAASTDDKQP